MSFFNDLFDDLGVCDWQQKLIINCVEDEGLVISGVFKILIINSEIVSIKTSQKIIDIEGENLMLKTLAKGEITVHGTIKNIKFGGKKS